MPRIYSNLNDKINVTIIYFSFSLDIFFLYFIGHVSSAAVFRWWLWWLYCFVFCAIVLFVFVFFCVWSLLHLLHLTTPILLLLWLWLWLSVGQNNSMHPPMLQMPHWNFETLTILQFPAGLLANKLSMRVYDV